jgi:hypothetical protein
MVGTRVDLILVFEYRVKSNYRLAGKNNLFHDFVLLLGKVMNTDQIWFGTEFLYHDYLK